jgi:hypothetical protein
MTPVASTITTAVLFNLPASIDCECVTV